MDVASDGVPEGDGGCDGDINVAVVPEPLVVGGGPCHGHCPVRPHACGGAGRV